MLSLEELLENRLEAKASVLNEGNGDSHSSLPEEQFEAMEVRRLLKEAIENLPERERVLVTLYYYEGLTYKEIGRVLEISESRVSQLYTRAVLRMRNRLSIHRADFTI